MKTNYFTAVYWCSVYTISAMVIFHIGFIVASMFGKELFLASFLSWLVEILSFVFMSLVLFMLFYPMKILHKIWCEGRGKKFFLGLLIYVMLNLACGYYWFFKFEIKKDPIDFRLF